MLPKIKRIEQDDIRTATEVSDSINNHGVIKGREKTDDFEDTFSDNIKPFYNHKRNDYIRSSRVSPSNITNNKPNNLSIKQNPLPVNEQNLKLAEEANIFGLSERDRTVVRKSVEETPKGEKKLDAVVRKFTGGKVISFADLLLNNKSNQDKRIIKLFKNNLQKYSDELLGIIKKILKNLWNLIINKAQQFSTNIKEKWESVKVSVVSGLNNLLQLEEKKSITTKGEVGNTSVGLLDSVKSLFLIMGGDKAHQKKLKKEGLLYRLKSKASKISKSLGLSKSTNADYEIGTISDGITNNDNTPIPISDNLKTTAGMRLGVYSALRKAGFSDKQSRILTAEIGRESSFAANSVFGIHTDDANGYSNIGMISWQKERNPQLVSWLKAAGLIRNNKMERSQASIDVQAKFIMWEMKTKKEYAPTRKLFLNNPNVDYATGTKVLGTNYILWRYTDRAYASGHKNRDEAYAAINKQLSGKGDADFSSVEQKTNTLAASLEQSEKSKKLTPRLPPDRNVSELGADSPITEVFTSQLSSLKNRKKANVAKEYHIPKQINTTNSNALRPLQRTQTQTAEPGNGSGSIYQTNTADSSNVSSKNVPSFFDMLIQRDLTGNMF